MQNLGSLACSVWAVGGGGWFENAAAHLIFGGNLFDNGLQQFVRKFIVKYQNTRTKSVKSVILTLVALMRRAPLKIILDTTFNDKKDDTFVCYLTPILTGRIRIIFCVAAFPD